MPNAIKTYFLSIFVILVLSLQAIIGLTYHGYTRWPFTSYPMYGGAKHAGSRITDFTLRAVLDDNREIPLSEDQLGMTFWILRKNVIQPIINDTFDRDSAASYFNAICTEFDGRIVGLKVYDIGVTVERNGPAFGDPKSVGSIEMTCTTDTE